jgi:Tol biopolymer transport system component
MRFVFVGLAVGVLAVCVAVVSRQAEGAFPGVNGKIAFRSDRDGNVEIYVMNSDGSNQVNLTNNPALDTTPAWSPDGTQIAFVSDRDGNREIYKTTASGSNQTRVTNNPATDRYPAWTSDGRIVFERGTNCGPGADVFIINADGTGEQNITNNAAVDCGPTGSSTGKVAFFTFRDGNGEIYSMNPDGRGLVRITTNTECDLYPNWSPDSSRIAFARDTDLACAGTDNDLYVMQADGSGEQRLTTTPSRAEFFAAWSPQGDTLAFDGCTNWPTGPCQIYTMTPSGGSETPLTSVGSNSKPDWQPAAPPPPPPPAPQPPPPPPPPSPQPPPPPVVGPPRVRVPRVLGLRLAVARTRIQRARCRVGRVRYARSRVRRGRVIVQRPRAGRLVFLRARVDLTVSRGRR